MSVFQQKLKSSFLRKKQKALIHKYNIMLSETITKYYMEVHKNKDKEQEIFERYNSDWKETAINLNRVNGLLFPLNVNAFSNYIESLKKR